MKINLYQLTSYIYDFNCRELGTLDFTTNTNGLNKKFHTIYFLTGEETFFIDKISKYIEKNTLNEDEKEFNQTILYGKERTIEDIILEAKLFPSFGEKRVVIVKETQTF